MLVEKYINEGRAVLDALKRNKIPVTEAFWYDIPDRREWRLIVASPMAHRVGPNEAYTTLNQILTDMQSPLSLRDISMLSPLSSEYRHFREEALGPVPIGKGRAPVAPRDMAFEGAYLYALRSRG